MWEQLNRIIKQGGAIVLFASQPFSSIMITSNLQGFAHQWVWNKRFAANFVQAKRQPLKDHEDVVVFSSNSKQPLYYPVMVKRNTSIKKGKNKDESGAIPMVSNSSYDKKVYNEKYPTSCESLKFNVREGRGLHPTQKPVALMEYLIKTYTNEGETVLDFTFGSGTTGVACVNTGRKFIGIEMDDHYFDIGSKRILESTKHE